MQEAVLRPDIPASAFQSIKDTTVNVGREKQDARATSVVKKPLIEPQSINGDEWDDGGLNDDDFIGAEPREDDFMDVDALDQPNSSLLTAGQSRNKTSTANTVDARDEQRLENGNYRCLHHCKDRNACKHPCCKVGVEKKPKPKPKPKKLKDSEPSVTASNSQTSSKESKTSATANRSKTFSTPSTKVQSKLELPIRGKAVGGPVEYLDLSQTADSSKIRGPVAATRLASLHNSTTKSSRIPTIGIASATPVSSASTGNSSRPKFMQSLNPLRSIEEEICDDPASVKSLFESCDDDHDKILLDDDDYLDKDEDMLDAALVGLEDSQRLQNSDPIVESTQGYRSLGMLDSGAEYQEDKDEPELFVTPDQQRVDDFTEGFEDAATMFESTDDYTTRPGMIKRKRDEGVPSAYFSAKKARTYDEEALQIYTEQSQDEEMIETVGEDEEDKERREKEELRAWLAAELGDSVEMI
jgi:hypothetical protein